MISASPRRLQVFKSVVDLGGFNAAAAHLDIAQPSVGAHVKALELEAGQLLLRRQRGTRPSLTEAGRIIYDLAADVVSRTEQTWRQLEALKAGQSRKILVAAHRDLALSFLPQRLARFSSDNPQVSIVTHIGTIEDVIAQVRSGSVQLGIVLSPGPMRGLTSELIGREPLQLVTAPSHPLTQAGQVRARDVARYPFVVGLQGSRFNRIVDRALRSIGLHDYAVALELQESSAVKQAVQHGQAIACLPSCAVHEEVRTGKLVALPLKQLPHLQIRCIYVTPPHGAARLLVAALVRSNAKPPQK